MSVPELRTLASAGWEIGSHGTDHTCCLEREGAALDDDLSRSRLELERMTGTAIRGFAYPQGCHGPEVVPALRRAGYAWACTSLPGTVRQSPSPHRLRRVTVGRSTTSLRFRLAAVGSVQAARRLSPMHRALAAGRHGHGTAIDSTRFA
jgi:peptidoglycan/xylan/chitin deacetylase (PgdA/CDA1 family)